MRTVNVYEAKTTLSRLLAEVEAGEEITISRNGRPVARMLPIARRTERRRFGGLEGRVTVAADLDEWSEQDEKDWFGE